MKTVLLIILMSCVGMSSFAGGSGFGGGPGKEIGEFSVGMGSGKNSSSTQVYFLRDKLSEIQFATVNGSDRKVGIHSLRPEEIQDSAVLEGLQRSRQSRQWEQVLKLKIK